MVGRAYATTYRETNNLHSDLLEIPHLNSILKLEMTIHATHTSNSTKELQTLYNR